MYIRFHTSTLLTQTLFLAGMKRWSCNMSYCFVHHVLWLSKARVCEKVFLLSYVERSSFQSPLKELVNLCGNSVLILCLSSTLSEQTLSCQQWNCPPRWPTSDPCLLAHCWPSSRAKAAGKAQLCLIAIHVQSVLLKQSPSPHEEQHVYPNPSGLASSCSSQRCQYVLAGEY